MPGDRLRRWEPAVRGLAVEDPVAADLLVNVVRRIDAAGGVAFEVIAGVPADSYGARITFRPAHDDAAPRMAAAAGLADHPWGVPDWIGVRARDGGARCKAYHRRPPRLGLTTVHRGLPTGLQPVMASLDQDAIEIYAVEPATMPWPQFVRRCLTGFCPIPDDLAFDPTPRATAWAFAASARQVGETCGSLTLYAHGPALPDDVAVTRAWLSGMTGRDELLYGRAVAAVGQVGSSPGRLHGLLAWTFDKAGGMTRAASLRVRGTEPVHTS